MVYIDFYVEPYVLAFIVVTVPFFLLWGIKRAADWVIEFIKVRQGFFSVNYILKNHQYKTRMIKPKGLQVQIDGKNTPFKNHPDYTAFAGSKKMIFFTRIAEKLQQMKLTAKDQTRYNKGAPSDNLFNDMLLEAEQVGKLFGLKKSKFEQILLIIAVIAAIGGLVGAALNMGMIQSLEQTINTSLANLPSSEAIAAQVQAALNAPVNPTVLTG